MEIFQTIVETVGACIGLLVVLGPFALIALGMYDLAKEG